MTTSRGVLFALSVQITPRTKQVREARGFPIGTTSMAVILDASGALQPYYGNENSRSLDLIAAFSGLPF